MSETKLIQTKDYLLLIDEEAEIKGDNCYTNKGLLHSIDGDGYHIIDYKNIDKTYYSKSTIQRVIGYYPLTEEAKELDLPLLPPFEKEDENIKKLADDLYWTVGNDGISNKDSFIKGYKTARSKGQYSLEDMKKAFFKGRESLNQALVTDIEAEEIIKSLSTQQLPTEFFPDTEFVNEDYEPAGCDFPDRKEVLKTITNSEGKEELVGTYKYC